MKNPARKDGQDVTQAEKILKESGLLDVLQKYGDISISKDNTAGTVLGGDINIHVVRDSRSRKKIPKIFDDIQRSTKFDSYRLANWNNAASSSGQLDGYYISVSKRILDKTWKVNIFLTKPKKEKRSRINILGALSSLLGRLVRLSISKGLLYISYALIAGLIFFASLGVLNSMYNGEFGFGTFSGEPPVKEKIIVEPEPTDEAAGGEEEGLTTEESSMEEESEMPIEEVSQEVDTGTSTEIVEEAPVVSQDCIFNTNLRFNDRGEEVERLQMFLADQSPEIYPDGSVSGWFGPLTREAVVRFQENYLEDVLTPWEINQGTGFVGTTTRAKINELCGAADNSS